MLQTSGLRFSHPDIDFRFPDITCPPGTGLMITGNSGKGKTTLLHLLAGLLKPQQGTITLNGTELSALRGRDLDRFRGKHIGIVFQRQHFVQSLTVEENILLANAMPGKKRNPERARELLETLNIADQARKKPGALSQGQQQRASIARAVMNHPSLILADEPTSSLDDTHSDIVASLLKTQAALINACLVVVTHDHRIRPFFTQEIQLS